MTSGMLKAEWSPALDRWLGTRYELRDPTPEAQRAGIDRVVRKDPARELTIAYACDERAYFSGFLFLEVQRNVAAGQISFAPPTSADWLLHLVVPRKVIAFRSERLRELLPCWAQRYRLRPAAGGVLGLLIPTPVGEAHAEHIAYLDEGACPALAIAAQSAEEDPQ
jgi:hypothetical protein